MPKNKSLRELIKEKALLVLHGYPTQGVKLDDLISITIELCQDDDLEPATRTVKSVIKSAGFLKIKGRYFLSTPLQKIEDVPEDELPSKREIKTERGDWRLRVYGGVRGSAG